jgi:hypothetical protein
MIERVINRLLADGVVVVHGLFLIYVAAGGFLSWRWPRAIWPHLVAVAWGVGIVAIGWDCPLTSLQEWFARRGGEPPPHGGFIDRYVEGHLWPTRVTPFVQLLVVGAIAVSWYGAWTRQPRTRRSHAA